MDFLHCQLKALLFTQDLCADYIHYYSSLCRFYISCLFHFRSVSILNQMDLWTAFWLAFLAMAVALALDKEIVLFCTANAMRNAKRRAAALLVCTNFSQEKRQTTKIKMKCVCSQCSMLAGRLSGDHNQAKALSSSHVITPRM